MKYFVFFACFAISSVFAQNPGISLYAQGFVQPVDIKHAGDDRLFIVERTGKIKIIHGDGTVNPEPFLTLDPSVLTITAEAGLLSMAFDPDYASNGYFYIVYISSGDLTYTLKRGVVDPENPNKALEGVLTDVLLVPVSGFHNSGQLSFGPDGYLYFTIGDGGGTDPANVAQNLASFHGKLHRIDVGGADGIVPYTIPSDNPYANSDDFKKEIWAWGLRNAWKFSFDRLSGDLWLTDVGENHVEEINHVNTGVANVNYGWKCYEGILPFDESGCTPSVVFTFPVAMAMHSDGHCAIAGGHVYRGNEIPSLQGKYVFSDFCRSRFGMVDSVTYETTYTADLPGGPYTFVSLGEDAVGELYAASISYGKIFKIVDADMSTPQFQLGQVKVSPNPASRQAQIRLAENSIPAMARIYDMAGKLLLKKRLVRETSQVDISALQNGIYVISIADDNGNSTQVKLAKI